jgi:hypothetical protein
MHQQELPCTTKKHNRSTLQRRSTSRAGLHLHCASKVRRTNHPGGVCEAVREDEQERLHRRGSDRRSHRPANHALCAHRERRASWICSPCIECASVQSYHQIEEMTVRSSFRRFSMRPQRSWRYGSDWHSNNCNTVESDATLPYQSAVLSVQPHGSIRRCCSTPPAGGL